jgi:hypothetical protein
MGEVDLRIASAPDPIWFTGKEVGIVQLFSLVKKIKKCKTKLI